MAGPFARDGGTTSKTSQNDQGVTITETTPNTGGWSLQNNGAAWVLVWGLALVAINLQTTDYGKAFYKSLVDPKGTSMEAAGAAVPELFLGLLFTGALTIVASLSADAAILALMFEAAISLILVFNAVDFWKPVLQWLTSGATQNHTKTTTKSGK